MDSTVIVALITGAVTALYSDCITLPDQPREENEDEN